MFVDVLFVWAETWAGRVQCQTCDNSSHLSCLLLVASQLQSEERVEHFEALMSFVIDK